MHPEGRKKVYETTKETGLCVVHTSYIDAQRTYESTYVGEHRFDRIEYSVGNVKIDRWLERERERENKIESVVVICCHVTLGHK